MWIRDMPDLSGVDIPFLAKALQGAVNFDIS